MTIALRAHHLFCLLTYQGKGYSPAFIENFDKIVERILKGEEIRLVEGPDDICRPMLEEKNPHCLHPNPAKRDRIAARYAEKLLPQKMDNGAILLTKEVLERLRQDFILNRSRKHCRGCKWNELCNRTAEENLSSTKIWIYREAFPKFNPSEPLLAS